MKRVFDNMRIFIGACMLMSLLAAAATSQANEPRASERQSPASATDKANSKTFHLFETVAGDPTFRANGKPLPPGYGRAMINQSLASAKAGDLIKFVADGGALVHFVIDFVDKTGKGNRFVTAVEKESSGSLRVMFSPSGGIRGTIRANGDIYLLGGSDSEPVVIATSNAGMQPAPTGDDVALPTDAEISEEVAPSSGTEALSAPGALGHSRISLLVLYDPTIPDVHNTIDYQISTANQIYADSDIDVSFELAASIPFSYAGITNDDALSAITDSASVASWRTENSADMVIYLRTYKLANGGCGTGWMVGANGGSMNTAEARRLSFTVVNVGTDQGYYCSDETFSHELGHNFGAAHDYENSSGVTPYYSYAYGEGIDGIFGTVMSYLSPEVGQFSNPRMTGCNGYNCGVVDDSDVSRAINNVREFYAGIFTATVPDAPDIVSAFGGQGAITLNFSSTGSGGSPITGYLAQCDGVVQFGNTSPITVSNLAHSTAYSCSVQAQNAVGTSSASTSVSVTTAGPPGGSDSDGDTIPDNVDNCPNIPNKAQWDQDGDGIGNPCDPDYGQQPDSDGDTIPDNVDNCPNVKNKAQWDKDGDGIGNACDPDFGQQPDSDGDTIPDNVDNCPNIKNKAQWDQDGDGIGNPCDPDFGQQPDSDGDTIPDNVDNCPNIKNKAQWDKDADGIGNACDPDFGQQPDSDGDTVPDSVDNCPTIKNRAQWDQDGDGIGNACDPDFGQQTDSDGDTILDYVDNCPTIPNKAQWDHDGDGIGNPCDPDYGTGGGGGGDDPVVPSSCENYTVPSNVDLNVAGSIDITWDGANPRATFYVGTKVVSEPFTTSSTDGLRGVFNIAASGSPQILRRLWISQCPGGAPLMPDTNKCDRVNSDTTTLHATALNDLTDLHPYLGGCGLLTEKTYYLNIEAPSCTTSACARTNRSLYF